MNTDPLRALAVWMMVVSISAGIGAAAAFWLCEIAHVSLAPLT